MKEHGKFELWGIRRNEQWLESLLGVYDIYEDAIVAKNMLMSNDWDRVWIQEANDDNE